MKTVKLGGTGLTVSEIGFGGIPIIPLNIEDGAAVVRHCYEKGITFFDTANVYRDSEKKVGQALCDVRDKVVIATKTLRRDAETAATHIRLSLENLRTDRIDIYQLHNVSNEDTLGQVLAPGGAYGAAKKAKEEGVVRFIGFSSHNVQFAARVCRRGLFSTVQVPFNFIETEAAEELLGVAAEMGMGVIGMKPLGGGLLQRADLCFKFLQRYPGIVPIPGVISKEEMDEIVSLYRSREPLTEADLADMERIRADLGTRFCHRCGYCLPCEKRVRIPEALGFKSILKRFQGETALNFSRDAVKSAENCDQCGACIERCPYELPIPEMLEENLALFREALKRSTPTAAG
ncbi:MAG: aldo/keto reductase [Syntrophaceae bacterium]